MHNADAGAVPGCSHPQRQEEPQLAAKVVLSEFVRVIIFIAYIINNYILKIYPRVSLEAMHEVYGGVNKLTLVYV